LEFRRVLFRSWPLRLARVHVVVYRRPRGLIWHHLLGDGMLDAGDAIPSRDDVSIVIDARDSLIVLDQCVAVLDVAVLTEDRRIEPACVSVGAEVPLEVANPEDDVGDGGGAGIDLEAE